MMYICCTRHLDKFWLKYSIFIVGTVFLNGIFNLFYFFFVLFKFISLFDMLRYASGVCLQIAAHLHIHVFRISSHQAPEQVQNHNDWLNRSRTREEPVRAMKQPLCFLGRQIKLLKKTVLWESSLFQTLQDVRISRYKFCWCCCTLEPVCIFLCFRPQMLHLKILPFPVR